MANKYLSLEQLQKAEYEILKSTVRFFEENDINYMLAFGTLLGAVRHNGFIPWDDDIDLLVDRKDYEKLKQLAALKKMSDPNLKIRLPGDDNYPYPFIKIIDTTIKVEDESILPKFGLNLWIDILPLDHFPEDENEIQKLLDKQMRLRKRLNTGVSGLYKDNKIKAILKRILYIRYGGYRRLCRMIDGIGKKADEKYNNTELMGNMVWAQYGRDYYNVSMLTPVIKHTFCDDEFLIPKNYHELLEYIYGDYSVFPPEDKRVRHKIKAYRIID
jgi:lipopolysaccharide cholinephosphotransferase